MKKIIGIIGVATFAMALFFNASTIIENNENIDLASLTALVSANAEQSGSGGYESGSGGYECSHSQYCHSWSETLTVSGGVTFTYTYDSYDVTCVGRGNVSCTPYSYNIISNIK